MDNNRLFYIASGLLIGLGVLLLLVVGSKTKLLNSRSSGVHVVKTTTGHAYVAGEAPKASWKRIGNPDRFHQNSGTYDSGYKPRSTFANEYVRAQEDNAPLVASTKFIKKKDKLKAKKDAEKKKQLAKNGKKGKGRFDPMSTSDDDSEPSTIQGAFAGPANAVAAEKKKKTAEQDDEDLNTVEFWIDPIFVQEDPQAVSKLMDSYRVKIVSNGVFYTVVTQMTTDERTNIRALSIDALSAFPSTQSFALLTSMKHDDMDPGLRTEAGNAVASYADVNHLNYVVNSLKPQDASAQLTIEALRTLTASAEKYGDLHEMGNGGGSGGTPSNVDPATLEPRYTKALELIEQNNYTKSSNATVKTEATKTVASINKFMTI